VAINFKEPKFKSAFEKEVYLAAKQKGWEYEAEKFDYTSAHTYTPDFSKKGAVVRLESKGRFRQGEPKKYLDIRKDNPHIELVFVFMNPNVPMPLAKRRRDGTKATISEWATKNNFQWCTLKTLKEFIG